MHSIEPQFLLTLGRSQLSSHFHSLLQSIDVNAINSTLINAVDNEAIPAPIFAVWLLIACRKSPNLLSIALKGRSNGVRYAGIKACYCIFRKADWKAQGWDALGGAAGIKNIIDGLSVREVQSLCKAIFFRCKKSRDRKDSSVYAKELLGLLSESHRDLSRYVLPLYPALSSESLEGLMSSTVAASLYFIHRAIGPHVDLFRRVAVGSVPAPIDTRANIIRTCAKHTVQSPVSYTPVHVDQSKLPPGLLFYLDLDRALALDEELRSKVDGNDWYLSYLKNSSRLASHHKVPFDNLLCLLKNGLPSVLEHDRRWFDAVLTRELLYCWSVARFGTVGHEAKPHMDFSPDHLRPSRHHVDELEALLIQVIQRAPGKTADVPRSFYRIDIKIKSRFDLLRGTNEIIKFIPPKARLPFLELVCRHSTYLKFDLNVWPPSEREARLLPLWDLDILKLLPAADSKALFRRSLAINGGDEFIPVDKSPDTDWSLDWEEQCQLKAKWDAQCPVKDDYAFTKKAITEIKRKSEQQKEPSDRLHWAKSAVDLAVQSSSLDIFRDVLDWSRRYIRDRTTLEILLDEHILDSDECDAVTLLSCCDFPDPRRPASTKGLRAVVDKANEILKLLLELILLAAQESSKTHYFTSKVDTSFFRQLVKLRVSGVQTYRKNQVGNESVLADILLNSLIPVILDYERAAMQDEGLLWSGNDGLIGHYNFPSEKPKPRSWVLSFLDQLAKQRNEIWKEYQKRQGHGVTTESWVKGLDIEHLVPLNGRRLWAAAMLANPQAAPFMTGRIHEVIFASSDVLKVVDEDKGEREIDPLSTAILFYLEGCSTEQKKDRIMAIWKHYSDMLQSDPANLAIFRNWIAKEASDAGLYDTARIIKPLQFPTSYWDQYDGSEKQITWNPRPLETDSEKSDSDDIPSILLHHRMCPNDLDNLHESNDPLSIWSLKNGISEPPLMYTLPLQIREALIISAILYLDRFTNTVGILRSPFPDNASPRFPRLFLDGKFCESLGDYSQNKPIDAALQLLKASVTTIPSFFLRVLAQSFLKVLKEVPTGESNSTARECVFQVIKLLPYTVQPDLALDSVLRVLEDYPDESSYHRHMRLLSLGQRLTPDTAEQFIQDFWSVVRDSYRQGSQKRIKITTVKMLAQLVTGADFIPLATRVNILSSLFTTISQIDVRVESANGILHILSRNPTDEIYKTFTALANSAAGPEGATEDWTEEDVQNNNRLLNIFVSTASTLLPAKYRTDYAENVLIPLLTESSSQHTTWIQSFLIQHNIPSQTMPFNFGPFAADLPNTILKHWREYLPPVFLSIHRTWAFKYQDLSSMHDTTEILSRNYPGWRETNAGAHWAKFISAHTIPQPLQSLQKPLEEALKSSGTGLTADIIGEEFIERARAVTCAPTMVLIVVTSLNPLRKASSISLITDSLNWLRTQRTTNSQFVEQIMQRIMSDIESCREETWLKDSSGIPMPEILPSRLHLQALLLPSTPMSHSGRAVFVKRVLDLVESCATNPVDMLDFGYLKEAIGEIDQSDRLDCAVALGSETGDGLEACLLIQLASALLENVDDNDKVLSREVKKMVENWQRNLNEWIRRVGWEVGCIFDRT